MANENVAQIRIEDLEENPSTRVAIGLCLDRSYSMGEVTGGTPTGETLYKDGKQWTIVTGGSASRIEEMVKGVERFYEALREDDVARYSAEPGIVTFGDTAECVVDFSNLKNQEALPKLTAAGETAMGEAVNLTLDLLEKRKQEYKEAGVEYYQPWLVIMSDGRNTGDEEELERAIKRVEALANARKLTVIAIGIGEEADMATLNRLSPNRVALPLKDLNFSQFFEWLSKSVGDVTKARPGEDVQLDTKDLSGWADIKA